MPFLACIALVVIIYYPVFFKGYWAVNRSDCLNMHLPNNYCAAEAFSKGKLPLWNHNFNLGQPLIDGSSLIFHPALILYMLFNPWLANTAEILLGLVLAFLGIWFFLRQQGFELLPAAAGTIAYVLCGPVFFLHSYHLDFMAILLLPWILWVIHKYDLTKQIRWLWTAAILCILAVQSIEPDTVFYLYIGLIIDRLACFPVSNRKSYISTWSTVFLLSGLSGLLTYLPLYEWAAYSSRLSKSYIGTLTPDFLNMLTAMFTNQWLTRWPFNSFYFYFGPALIWLVLAGLAKFNKTDYHFRYFLFSLFIPASYIITRFLQLYHSGLFNSLDIWRSMFVFCFGLAMICSIGVSNILNGQRSQKRLALLCGLLTAALAIWAIISSMYIFRKYLVLLLAATGMLVTAFSMSKKTVTFRFPGICVALAATLMISSISFITNERFCILAGNSSIIKKLAFYKALGKDLNGKEGHWRVSIFGPTDNTTSLAGLMTVPNYTCIYNKNMEDTFCSDGLIARNDKLPYWMQLNNPDAHGLSFYGVRFLVTLEGLLPEKNNTGWIERPDLSWPLYSVWENKYYIGRAYLVRSTGERRDGTVEFLEDTPVSVVMRAEAEGDESLVLADLSYPGWKAWVDGKSVPAEVYHGCLRSVRLSKGTHIVQWKYSGQIQWGGIILSLIALFLLAVFLIILSIRKII